MRKHFTYVTTNLINGKQYVGDHSTNNIDDKYLGSGLALKNAIKKYSKQNFKRKILEYFDTRHAAFNTQEKYINEYNTLAPNGYNISPKGGHDVSRSMSDGTKRKLSKLASKRVGIKTSFYGKKHTNEAKEKMRLKHLGQASWNKGKVFSEETKEKMSIAGKKRIGDKNSMFGKKHSEYSKYLMSKKAKIKSRKICKYCNKEITIAMHNRWHGEKCKIKKKYEKTTFILDKRSL